MKDVIKNIKKWPGELRCDDTWPAGQAFIERMKRYITVARKQNSLHQRCED